ncbi:hypothetical protein ABIB38_004481, partial [Massilia sp. UYP11]|uniref:hypothetical protein n=1 Tax=Massilia sp. UYP11 TaxID=1756385 RepID=UPI003D1AC4F4
DAKTPILALKEWQQRRPELFVKRVYEQAGLDTYRHKDFQYSRRVCHGLSDLPGRGSAIARRSGVERCRYNTAAGPLAHRAVVLPVHTVFP